ncbi:cordon-bleu protein-like 1 [Dicentrarchus labrax]|uniref:Cordon-bleu ubiquitin-like domain-containing protein n=1 Tax=Dicentrarchus labrax TaxID=13489 RepID=A0A8P4GGN8_DICLA|nr:cordon-bleu protein-like 1 [Dicentrarchus labrax]XP_051284023.1 cordon-bleu protein-like 1 [Dicentrarchus labrax]
MDEEVNPLERDHTLSVVLPGGLERNATVHGSKPVMDLLVTLCASYRLNPSDYTVEVLSPNKNIISFKPNSPIGSLEAEKIVLKPKGIEEKIRRPYMPEASVRLLINYNKSHKAVVRVNPRVPLEMLLPVVCDKCEFKAETTILMRDSQSQEPLDLTKSLNDLELREVFAKDTADRQHQAKTPDAAVTQTEVISPPPPQDLPKKEKKQKENLGFLSLFRRRKKHPEMEGAVSPPDSPGLYKQVGGRMNGQDVSSSNNLAADVPKKRRAPQPPMGASQSVPNNLSTCHLRGPQRSAESTLRSTKRRAPPPPCANQELQEDTEVKATVDSLITVEKRESEESDSVKSLSSSSSTYPSHSWSSKSSSRPSFAHLHEVADPYLPSFRGKDLTDARCALAKVMTSSISKGTLVRRLRNSATFPKLYNGSSFMSMTQRFSENGDFYAEPEPVLTSNLPTEPEWEDPAQRRGMTTFKVVPSKKQKSHDSELTVDVPDQITIEENPESEASSEVGKNQTEPEEDPCSPARSETETPLQSPEPSQETEEPASLPPPLDEDNQDCPVSPLCEVRDTVAKQEEEDEPEVPYLQSPEPSSQETQASEEPAFLPPPLDEDYQECPGSPLCQVGDIGEKQEEEVEPEVAYLKSPEPSSQEIQASEEPASLPPPLDVDDQDCPGSPLSEVGGTVEKQQEEEDEPEVTSEVVQATPSDCSDGELASDGQIIISEDQSELLQSPSRQFVSTDIDHCGSNTDERKVKEEEDSFPPPPPPVFFNEEIEVMEEGREDTTASSLPSSQPLSLSSNGQTNAFSELTSATPAAAPKPLDKISSAPSRFAQAVALAVQRSRPQSRGKSLGPQAPSGPQSTLPSPPRTIYQFGA